MNRLYILIFKLMIISLGLCSCFQHYSIPSVETRVAHADQLAAMLHWKARTLYTSNFVFKAYGPKFIAPKQIVTIYIEGDGFAWQTPDTPSDNPTPISPMGLKLALQDKKHQAIVYLGRACQYIDNKEWRSCQVDYWTTRRFSSEIIQATNQAIDILKSQIKAQKIILIGYSGGGAIAALVAARREDVLQLITIAGVLDIDYWIRQKSLSPLNGSLNPADEWRALVSIPQIHWVGEHDTVVPQEVALAYAARFPASQKPNINIIPLFTHHWGWEKNWGNLLKENDNNFINKGCHDDY